jgi:hypothetical protein
VKALEGWMRGVEGERWTYEIVLFPHFLGVEIGMDNSEKLQAAGIISEL